MVKQAREHGMIYFRDFGVYEKVPEEECWNVRLALAEILFGTFILKDWVSHASQVPGALVIDDRGVYDALAKSCSR